MKNYPKKKQLKNWLHSRLFMTILLLLFQLGFFAAGIIYLSRIQMYLSWALRLVSILVVFRILSTPDNPSYKISWILVIMIAPLMGGLFYLIFGNKSVGRNVQKKLDQYTRMLSGGFFKRNKYTRQLAELNPLQGRLSDYLYNMSGAPPCSNTSAQYFPLGEDMFEQMVKELKNARKFIFMEYFIIREGIMWDTILDILEEKAKSGVEVRLIYDDAGCIKTLPDGYEKVLRSKGIRALIFNPFQPHLNTFLNHRDHRKICVIDGNVGFTGGINLADEYINQFERFGHWKDTGVMLRGDAVRNFTELFLQIWQVASGKSLDWSRYFYTQPDTPDGLIQPFGGSPLDSLHVAENAYMQMINQAKKYLYITTPYLILDNEMVTSLRIASQSGIDVRIITPSIPDKWYVHHVTRSYYLPLLESGVRIYEYTPGFIHAKMCVSDDETAIVGTTNMDYRSFYLHFECGVAFYNSSVIYDVKQDFLSTQAISREITLTEQQNVAPHLRLIRSLLRILAPLM